MIRADLHIHTPHSLCYADRSATADEIVQTAIARGLDLIAITDHHSFAGAREVLKAASGTGLSVIPGLEITTQEGHFVGLFEASSLNSTVADDFVHWLGITKPQLGDGHAIVDRSVESVLERIFQLGGLGIAAHIDRWPSGFLESSVARSVKESIHANPHLSALEITIPEDRLAWNSGEFRGFPKRYACVQSSDAHAVSDIGRRTILVDNRLATVQSLRETFLNCGRGIEFFK